MNKFHKRQMISDMVLQDKTELFAEAWLRKSGLLIIGSTNTIAPNKKTTLENKKQAPTILAIFLLLIIFCLLY